VKDGYKSLDAIPILRELGRVLHKPGALPQVMQENGATLIITKRNSTIADKPRETFVQYEMGWMTP